MSKRPLIVGLGGSIRANSITERALRVALEHAGRLGCRTKLIGNAELPLELYDPGTTSFSDRANVLIESIREADGIIFGTPSYHGGVSGHVKNAIDFIEALRTDERPYLQGRAVGVIVCADGMQAMGSTISSLRDIIHSLRGWPTPYSAALHTLRHPFGADGQEADPAALRACQAVADEVVEFVRMRVLSAASMPRH
ncbi:MAG: NAD(P)H-dependent oxidoreductase [Lautropia sp.]|nr:NAD(P)H-dependent oxidoreductase [Lautropia sp.]